MQCIVFHHYLFSQHARFYAIYPDTDPLDSNTREELIEAGATLVAMPEHIGGGDLFILWIDDPAPDTERAQRAVTACAQAKTAQAVRDLAD